MALSFRFGVPASFVSLSAGSGLTVGVACPVAGGAGDEAWPMGAPVSTGRRGEWSRVETPDFTLFALAVPVTDSNLEPVTAALYAQLLRETAGLHLYRVWHFVPRINAVPASGLENYRAFCRARALAFEAHFRGNPESRMPSASAVGVDGDRLVIVAVAGRAVPEHFENPEQTPAYRYPAEYGPKPPSFARATRVRFADATWCFISGTASIKGCETLHAEDFAAQLRVTEDNLALMRDRLGVGRTGMTRRTYVREASAGRLVDGGALRADICRADLLLEVEEACLIPHAGPVPHTRSAGGTAA